MFKDFYENLKPGDYKGRPVRMNRKTAEAILDGMTEQDIRAVIEETGDGMFTVRVVG